MRHRNSCYIKRILFWLCIIPTLLQAQYSADWLDNHVDYKIRKMKLLRKNEQLTTQNQTRFDVTYYGLNLALSVEKKTVSGFVELRARALVDALDRIELNLNDNMAVEKVLARNQTLEFTHANGLLKIQLAQPYSAGETFAITIHYGGQPQANGFGSFNFDQFNSRPMIWSLSEPFGARDWFPCKDIPSDKADSADIKITVPKELIVASNGTLKEIIYDGDVATYCWYERYPISTYLISIAAHEYHTYSDYYVYSETDSMEIQFYVFPEHLEKVRENYARTAEAIEYFSEIFGPYPFLSEKYGHAEFLWSGGMEHQTITSLGGWSLPLIIHELAHQWWGDMITCSDFHHIWLNEGFATYAEALYWEHFYGNDQYAKDMDSKLYFGPGTIYVENLSDVNRIFDGGLSYHKAAWVLHMLRHVVGDEAFFRILKDYAADPQVKYGAVTTEMFQEICERVAGFSLDWFFEQWIYGEYYPTYFYRWERLDAGNSYHLDVVIEQKQQRTGLFKMPIDVTVATTSGDTTIVVWDSLQTQTFEFEFAAKPVNVYLDRDNWILKEIHRPSAIRPGFYVDQNYPNPLNLSATSAAGQHSKTSIDYQIYFPSQVTLRIYNALGQLVKTLVDERQPADAYSVDWDGSDSKGGLVASGIYIYELVVEGDRATEKMTVIR
ncbi:hypothetical protein JXJ21_12375 [candidate division KSB1 bacterium]|nr:hypothetical protein [candidate division KSB1 bacterium]